MKFSLKIFLSLAILVGMTVLVMQQVLVLSEKNPELSLQNAFLQTVNPFWTLEENTNNFPAFIPFTIKNPTESDMLPSGNITLWQGDTQLKNIAVIDEKNNPPGFLTDTLLLNPENITISPNSSHTFQVEWKGFGDAFFERHPETGGLWNSVIRFSTPADMFQSRDAFQMAFYEKLITKKHHFDVTVKSSILAINTQTGDESRQEIQDFPLQIPYTTLEKTVNTGMILNFGLTLIFLLLLWHTLSVKWKQKKFHISKETIAKFESELHKQENIPEANISEKMSENKKPTYSARKKKWTK